MLATRVISRIRDRLHVELPIREFFDAPSIRRLALVIDRSEDSDLDDEEDQRSKLGLGDQASDKAIFHVRSAILLE